MKNASASCLLVAAMVVVMPACSNKKPDADALAITPAGEQAGAAGALAAVAEKFTDARNNQLDLYAPANMKRAYDAISDAQKAKQRGRPDTDVMQLVGTAEGYLTAAQNNRTLAQNTLREAIAQRGILEELGTARLLPREYAKATEQFRDLMGTLEGGNTGRAMKEQQKVLASYAQLEIDTLKATYLVPAENLLKKAEDADADDYAPVTYKAAKNTLATASEIIEKSPKDRANVRLTGEAALVAANKAYHVADESRQIVKLDEKKAEQRVLHYYSLMARINTGSGVHDLGAMSLEEQATALAKRMDGQSQGGAQLEVRAPAQAAPAQAAPAKAVPVVAPTAEPAPEPAPAPAATDSAPAAVVAAPATEPQAQPLPEKAPAASADPWPAEPAPSAAAPAEAAPAAATPAAANASPADALFGNWGQSP